ncbi:MAG: adenosylcobinamide-phosphate synthase CbiB [Oscillospiraceae bacterium]
MSILPLLLGYILDLILGDPYNIPHPVRFIGSLISKTENLLRRLFPKTAKGELISGIFMPIIVVGISTVGALLILKLAYKIHVIVGIIVDSIMCYQMLATKCLKDESMKVYQSLKNDDLELSRENVSMIVGRDTQNLDVAGVTKATVETIAENTSDGIIAPMIYMALFGSIGGFFYKSVNTLDSMIGYKNDKYLYFGRASAKLDDLLNYIPSRISAIFVIVATFFLNLDFKSAFRIWRRDCRNHPSPNSAQTESAFAGVLNVQLAGDMYYFGKLHHKKTIGDNVRPIQIEDIKTSNNILYVTSFISLIFCLIVRCIVV